MCRRWSTSWPDTAGPLARALLALALLLAPLAAWQAAPAAEIPVCSADGGVRHVPDPLAPAQALHAHCEACLVVPPALPVPAMALRPPLPYRIAPWPESADQPAPATLPPRQARAPPLA